MVKLKSVVFRINLLYRKNMEKFIIPPYDEKRKILLSYKEKFGLKIFIETGTFLGDTIQAFRNDFGSLISFELSEDLADKAIQRFKDDGRIKIVHGDSGKLLSSEIRDFDQPCLFWLDGHYSSEFFIGEEFIKTAKGDKDTPILQELEAILSHKVKNHVILIDDARCFKGKDDYPSFEKLVSFVKERNPKLNIVKKRDIIRITPQ
jgi:hypothetical protein